MYGEFFFIHELLLENDRAAVKMSFLFLIACFYIKMFYKNPVCKPLNL